MNPYEIATLLTVKFDEAIAERDLKLANGDDPAAVKIQFQQEIVITIKKALEALPNNEFLKRIDWLLTQQHGRNAEHAKVILQFVKGIMDNIPA
jgi:ABC-type phosphate transport system substrate-binding protein